MQIHETLMKFHPFSCISILYLLLYYTIRSISPQILGKKVEKDLNTTLHNSLIEGEKMLNETFIQLIMKQIQKAENNKFMPLNLSKEQEKKLEKLSPELYSKYIQIKERNATEREKFKAEIKDVTAKIEKRLGAYNVKVIASFDNDDKPLNHPGHYYILVKFTRKLSKDEFAAFVSNAKAIGLKFNPQDKTWGYVGEIGQYPPFNL